MRLSSTSRGFCYININGASEHHRILYFWGSVDSQFHVLLVIAPEVAVEKVTEIIKLDMTTQEWGKLSDWSRELPHRKHGTQRPSLLGSGMSPP